MNNHMSIKVLHEITIPFLNFNDCTVKVLEWISYFIRKFIMNVTTYLKVNPYQ